MGDRPQPRRSGGLGAHGFCHTPTGSCWSGRPWRRARTAGRLRGGALRIAPLTARLDATTLTGWAQRSGGAAAGWTFDLHANRINFGNYLPPARKHPKPLSLPLAMLRALRAQGTLTISRATYGGTVMRDLRLQVQ